MSLVVANKRSTRNSLADNGKGDTLVVDVTSRARDRWQRFSPFYPHGGIPVPYSPSYQSQSVEGIWQGLKVFERADVDVSRFAVTTMKGLKRSARTYGRILGHRQGVNGNRLLDYVDARRAIYLPAYRWVLDNCLRDLVRELAAIAQERTVVLLDYSTNADVDDPSRPLSHAGLVKRYVEDDWPACREQPDREGVIVVR